MPRPRAIDEATLTPFGHVIYRYLREQWINVNQFAERTGLSAATTWKWLRDGSVPEPETVAIIARKTGIALDDLLDAAVQTAIQRSAASEVWDYLLGALEERLPYMEGIGDRERGAIVRGVREIRDTYATEHARAVRERYAPPDGILVLREAQEDAPDPAAPSHA